MHVVVVQAGQHGSARRVEHVLTAPRRQRVGHVVDAVAHPEVDDRAVQGRCPLNQHGAQILSATRRSTAALSAPSGDADGDGRRLLGRRDRDAEVRRPRQRRVAGGDLGHRHVDHLAAAAAQRLSYRARRLQPAQRVGDRVAAEHRPVASAPTSPPATAASSPNAGRSG